MSANTLYCPANRTFPISLFSSVLRRFVRRCIKLWDSVMSPHASVQRRRRQVPPYVATLSHPVYESSSHQRIYTKRLTIIVPAEAAARVCPRSTCHDAATNVCGGFMEFVGFGRTPKPDYFQAYGWLAKKLPLLFRFGRKNIGNLLFRLKIRIFEICG